MKQFLIICIFICTAITTTHAQSSSGFLSYPDGRPVEQKGVEGVEGSPYLSDSWNQGDLTLNDGTAFNDVLMRFNLHNNKIYFKKNNEELECVSPVIAFKISYLQGHTMVTDSFRCGYPAIDGHSVSTFYKVLAGGKFELLVYVSKYVETFQEYSGPTRREYRPKEALYAFLPGNKLVSLQKNKEDLIAAAPEYASLIKKIESSQKLKLKRTSDMIQLFEALNKEAG